MAETDKPCRGRNSAAEASDGHGRQEQERVTDAARREDRSGARLVSEPTEPGEGQRQMAQPHTCFPPGRVKPFFFKPLKPGWLGGPRGTPALLYVGSDPALWPAGERRERRLITYDKGYYHSYTEEVFMPDYPTLIPKTSTPTPETLPGGGIQLPALFSPDSATAHVRTAA